MSYTFGSYEIQPFKIQEAKIAEYYKKYLHISFLNDGVVQTYPACSTDIEKSTNYFKDCLGITDLNDAIGMDVWCICSFSEIIGVVSVDNNKFFSLQGKFFPQQYNDDINKIIEETGNDFIKKLAPEDAFICALLTRIRDNDKNPQANDVKRFLEMHHLNKHLQSELKINDTTNKTIMKI